MFVIVIMCVCVYALFAGFLPPCDGQSNGLLMQNDSLG
jgi:hypothetical protein